MIKRLRLLKTLPAKGFHVLSMAICLLLLVGSLTRSQAQIYLVTNDGTGTTLSARDGISKINADGTGRTILVSSISNSPGMIALDLLNNRAFVYEAYTLTPPTNLAIKVINLSTGATINAITWTQASRLVSLKYDAVNNWIYFVLQGSNVSGATDDDAICRVRPDGTEKTVLLSGTNLCKNPGAMALDIPTNRMFVMENLYADRALLTIDLKTNTVTQTKPLLTGAFVGGVQMDYDPDSDFLYLLSSDNNNGKNPTDAIYKFRTDASSTSVVAGSIGARPVCATFDFPHNVGYFFDNGVSTNRVVYSVNLTTGALAPLTNVNDFPENGQIYGMIAPYRPVVSSAAASSISSTTVTLAGNVVQSDLNVSERGVIYSSTNATPTVDGTDVTKIAVGDGLGTFSTNVSGINASTVYYARAYGISSAGTAYGDVKSFTTISNNANLSAFALGSGTLSPAFNSATTTYTAGATYDITSIKVTPTVEQANATIKVNGTAVTSGNASGALNLNPGTNTITTTITAQDGVATKTYTTTITKDKTPQTITFNPLAAKAYGAADFTLVAAAGSTLPVTFAGDNNNVATVTSDGVVHIVGAGTVNIITSQAGNTIYLAATNISQQLTVNKAVLTYTANTASRDYGAANPTFTGNISGFLNSDTQASATTGTMAFTSTATTTASVGTQYPINGSGLSAANYSFAQATGNSTALSIGKITLTYTAQAATKVYGAANPSFNVVFTGFANSEVIGGITSGITYLTTATANSGVGTYPITVSGLSAANYDFTPAAGNTTAFTITKANLTFTANTATRKYGEANPGLSGSITGFVNTDGVSTLTGTATYSTTATATSGTGTYPVTLSGLSSPNYNILAASANNTALSVTKNTLKYLATAASRAFNTSPEPAITGIVTGFLNSDTQASATTGTLSFSTSVTASSPVGSYAISGAGLSSTNYDIVQDAANASAFSIFNSSNGYLSNLTLSDGILSPVFAQGTNNYTATVVNNVTSITITPTLSDIVNARVTVNGQSVTSGNGYTVSSLNIGSNTITINVTAQDGVTRVPYSLTVTRLPSPDATLKSLAMTNGTLGAPNAYDVYLPTVDNGVTSVDITAIVNDEHATIAIDNNISIGSGVAYTIPLNVGENIHNIFVTAQDGTTAHIYGLNIRRAYSSNNLLSSLVPGSGTLSPAFSSSTETYDLALPNSTKSVDFTASTVDNTAGFYIDGHAAVAGDHITIDLGVGTTPIVMRVVAQDGSVKNYTVNVTRAASTDASLSSLGILTTTGAIETFDANTYTYNTTVSSDVTQFRVKPVSTNDGASITVNGVPLDTYNGNAYTMKYLSATEPQTIVVTAGDGVTQKTYTINVVRNFSTNNLLQSLSVRYGTNTTAQLSPDFDPATNNYSIVINDPSITTATITPIVQDTKSLVRIGGQSWPTNAARTVDIQGGSNVIPITVEAFGAGVNTYTLTVNRAYSSNAGLSSVGVSGTGITTSPFALASNSYTVNIPYTTTAVFLSPTASDGGGTVLTVNGYTVAYQDRSASLPVVVGDNIFTVGITAADNSNTQYYSIHINRLPFADVTLSALGVSKGTLNPAFTPNTKSYSVVIAASDTSVSITPVATVPGGVTVDVNGDVINGAHPTSTYNSLFAGSASANINVKAADGITSTIYRLTVVHPSSNQAFLGNIALSQGSVSPAFARNTITYTASVPYAASTILFTPQSAEANATITVTKDGTVTNIGGGQSSATIPLTVGGNNIVTTTITSQDGSSTKTYTVTITRGAAATDATLTNLTTSTGTLNPVFSGSTYTYTINVKNEVSAISVFPVAHDAKATVKIGLAPVSTGLTVPLSVGDNNIVTTVTAEDGSTQPYTLTVNRAAVGTDATLTAISLSEGTLNPVFASGTTNYTASVSDLTDSLSVAPLAYDPNSTIKINGTPIDGSVGTATLPLSLGNNILTIDVKAPDSTHTQTYTLTVTRGAAVSSNALLSALTVSPGTLSPVFDANTTAYNAGTVTSESVKISATTADTTATILVNGNGLYSGNTLSVPLVAGSNTIKVKITAQDSTTVKEYTIALSRIVPAAPTLTYAGPQTFTNGVTIISPVMPTSSGVDPAGGYTAAKTTVSTEMDTPTGITRDVAGNLYVANYGNGTIYKLPAGGGAAIAMNTDAINGPYNMAVDAAGNVYVAAVGEQNIRKIPAAGGHTTSVPIGHIGNTGVALDAAGNIYVTNVFTSSLYKVPVGGGSASVLSNDFDGPYAVAVDSKGNVYVNNAGDNTIKKLPAGTSSLVTIASAVGTSTSLAIDAAGSNLYIADGGAATIVKIPTNGDSPVTLADGFNLLFGVTIGDEGELYITDNGNSQVQKISPTGGYFISPALPAGLTFDTNTGAIGGKPTALATAADYTVTGYNSGGKVQATVNVKVTAPEASLANLSLSTATLSPVFASAQINYTSAVPNLINSITLTPTATDATAVIKVNGVVVPSGTASGNLDLNEGDNTITVTVKTADSLQNKTYTVLINRAAAGTGNARLKGIVISPVSTLTLVTGPPATSYETSVGAGVSKISLTAFTLDPSATMTIEGVPTISGMPSDSLALNTDTTTIHVRITAPDGLTTKLFTVLVKHNGSSNTLLTSLPLSPLAIYSQITGPASFNYGTSVPAGTKKVVITPTAADAGAIITVEGKTVQSGMASDSLALNPTGGTTIHLLVRGQDGVSSRTYEVTVTRNGSSNVKLQSLVLSPSSALTLSPTGTASVNYTTSVAAGTDSIRITAIPADVNAKVDVNGIRVTNGQSTGNIALNATGATPVLILVTAEDGTTTRTYSISVSKLGSSNVNLSGIQMTPASLLTQISGSSTVNYRTSVVSTTTVINITPIAEDTRAIITVNGTVVTSGSASGDITLLPIASGPTNVMIRVTGQDGITVKTYAIAVYRNGSSYAKLKGIQLDPVSTLTLATDGPASVNYTTSVPSATTTVRVTPVAFDASSVVTVNGVLVPFGNSSAPVTLNSVDTRINVLVTAQDGFTTRTYSVLVHRKGSSNVNLKGITLDPVSSLTIGTGSSYVNYVTSVVAGTGTVKVSPVAEDPTAVIRVNNVIVASGGVSGPIVLNSDGTPTLISLLVKGQDNETTRTYSITVNQDGSSNYKLKTLQVTPASPLIFVSRTYSTTVPNTQTSIQIRPTAIEAGATIKVGTELVTSGALSTAIALQVGVNNIPVEVTAPDGKSITTYTVQVTRDTAAPSFRSTYTATTGIAPKADAKSIAGDIKVHQAVSPNGDGQNDVLNIEGIEHYSENHLSIMNSGGQLVFETRSYNTNGNVFDGHSNKTGTMQKPGTYYYSLEYKDGNDTKRKTGYIILKY